MPFFSGPVRNRQIIIAVRIGHPYAHIEQPNDRDQLSLPAPPTEKYTHGALVDTGATHTSISPKIVKNLGLIPVRKVSVSTPTDNAKVNQYRVGFHIPIAVPNSAKPTAKPNAKPNTKFEYVHSTPILEVAEMIQPRNYDVLLGMDILKNCTLFIARDTFTLGY